MKDLIQCRREVFEKLSSLDEDSLLAEYEIAKCKQGKDDAIVECIVLELLSKLMSEAEFTDFCNKELNNKIQLL